MRLFRQAERPHTRRDFCYIAGRMHDKRAPDSHHQSLRLPGGLPTMPRERAQALMQRWEHAVAQATL